MKTISVLTIVLTIIFVILRLCNVIAWSWVWVLAPLWIGLFLVAFVIGIINFIYDMYS